MEFYICPNEKCRCHKDKKHIYKTNPSGVAFDANSGCWVFTGSLPSPATTAAQNGITMKDLENNNGHKHFELAKYPYQQWCTYLVDGKVCGLPIVRLKQLRKGHFATLNLCEQHRKQKDRDDANNYYRLNRQKVLAKRKIEYQRKIECPLSGITPSHARLREK